MTNTSTHVDSDCDSDDEPPSSIIDREGPSAFPGLEIDIDSVDSSLGDLDELASTLINIVSAVLHQQSAPLALCGEVFIRVVGSDDSQRLNSEFRGKNYATNVLSFPGTEPEDIAASFAASASGGPPVMLGDIIVAAPVVAAEASEQGKPVLDHFYHLITHGLLHLLGHDHIEDNHAEKMEAIEIVILAEMGIANPYIVGKSHVG